MEMINYAEAQLDWPVVNPFRHPDALAAQKLCDEATREFDQAVRDLSGMVAGIDMATEEEIDIDPVDIHLQRKKKREAFKKKGETEAAYWRVLAPGIREAEQAILPVLQARNQRYAYALKELIEAYEEVEEITRGDGLQPAARSLAARRARHAAALPVLPGGRGPVGPQSPAAAAGGARLRCLTP